MLLQQLSDACLVVDALEPSVREELVKNFCSKELTSYRQIFEGAGLALYMLHISPVVILVPIYLLP
jgi:vacuolar protein sorting-associated protein 53